MSSSMDVREAGNSTLVKAPHLKNASSPMDVREVEERSTFVKALQSENAQLPMNVREVEERSTFAKAVQ